jgi:flagellum-specific peptidoglycan hydrolase FlgJ
MITPEQKFALREALGSAILSGHCFPAMAACEAMVESAWGTSALYLKARNAFGLKQRSHPVFPTLAMPTKEDLDGQWTTISADFVQYPDVASCFADRMATLERLKNAYPHYAAALSAGTAEEYVTQVSKSWSTAPDRAANCIAIYNAHQDVLA